ncbi:hypothetical protein [Halomonas aquatica]|uniref:Flavin reductase like domain-containing protein n=1 Tax=Halomonas aquatica TaxID=3151123 RepID=A0ABV1NGK1_9GAMM
MTQAPDLPPAVADHRAEMECTLPAAPFIGALIVDSERHGGVVADCLLPRAKMTLTVVTSR